MSGPARKILCIEDNPVNWRLVQRLLSQAGYELHWAEEGLKGYEMALELRPHLVLLDINLPGLSGFEIAAKFRQHSELKAMPIVALTAKTLKSDRETALVAGCDGFIPKPIDPFTFVKQVEQYLGGQRERIEQAREGEVLRSFNVQMLEHLEAQLREAQEANSKLLAAQGELEARNRSLTRLLALGQRILSEHDPVRLLGQVLEQVVSEVQASGAVAFRMHPSGGYLEGLRWSGPGAGFTPAPVMPPDHAFCQRLRSMTTAGPLPGDRLRSNRIWDEGLALGFWTGQADPCLLVLPDRQSADRVWGFWVLTREGAAPFLPEERELIALHASFAQVSLENAELIASLNESSRALASSYERMETAYQDLQTARAAISRQERQGLLEDLFLKITLRLEDPVLTLSRQSQELERLMEAKESLGPALCDHAAPALRQIREAVGTVDGLLKALMRRADKEAPATPEWVQLHALLTQELELLEAEGVVPSEAEISMSLEAPTSAIYGVYGDFARLLQHLMQHAFGGPLPSGSLALSTQLQDDHLILEITDQGGPIPDVLLAQAFEPFSELHQQPVMGIRSPGAGLPHCRQLLLPYHGDITIANEGEGTRLRVALPLK